MAHVIANSEIERLAQLAGVVNFDDWQRQYVDSENKIALLISGDIGQSWNACLPIWIEFGRVKDLSEAVRVPRYWPSFARNLGYAFAGRFQDQFEFLVKQLRQEPVNSYEYLFACDLLLFIVDEFSSRRGPVPAELFLLQEPLSPVIDRELAFEEPKPQTVGEMLKRYCDRNYADQADESMTNASLRVSIVRFTDDYQPGIVEISIKETDGRETLFEIKQVYVTEKCLDWNSEYPQPGLLDCTVIEVLGDCARIEAEERQFTVPASAIVWPASS